MPDHSLWKMIQNLSRPLTQNLILTLEKKSQISKIICIHPPKTTTGNIISWQSIQESLRSFSLYRNSDVTSPAFESCC